MNHQRIDQLLTFLQEEPNDPFIKYALAQEYLAYDPQRAKTYFVELMKENPDYVGTYYHAAQLFFDLDEDESLIRKTYETGIQKAQEQGDMHALTELKNALTNWEMESLM